MTTHYCYVVRVGSNVKIGYSASMEKRMKTINTHAHTKPQILCLFPFQTETGARACEKRLHYNLRFSRLNGEWFSASRVIKFLKASGTVLFDEEVELPDGAIEHMRSF